MKTLKNTIAVLAFILVAACSRNEEPTSVSNLAISGINPAAGAKNTTVFITGVDFSQNAVSNIVTLNGKACTVNTASATSLSITIPRGAGSGKISVSVNGTTVQSPNFDYQITPSVEYFSRQYRWFCRWYRNCGKFQFAIFWSFG